MDLKALHHNLVVLWLLLAFRKALIAIFDIDTQTWVTLWLCDLFCGLFIPELLLSHKNLYFLHRLLVFCCQGHLNNGTSTRWMSWSTIPMLAQGNLPLFLFAVKWKVKFFRIVRFFMKDTMEVIMCGAFIIPWSTFIYVAISGNSPWLGDGI